MLKGRARIELTNVYTGEVEVHEEDNLVTNAVARQLNLLRNAAALADNTFNDSVFFPIYQKMTNGILLFQELLEEDINNMALPAPATNPLVGYASNNAYSGDDVMRGGMNLNESEELENGYKYVWDFATSQANGQISALALTSYICGAVPYYNSSARMTIEPYRTANNNEFIRNLVEFNFDTGIAKQLFMQDAVTLLIRNVDFHFVTVGLKDTPLVPTTINVVTVDLSSDNISLNVNCQWIDGEDGYYYALYANSSKTVSVARLSKESLTLDENFGQKTITLSQSVSIRTDNTYYAESAIVLNGYLYIVYASYIFKINMNNFEDVTTGTQSVYSVTGAHGLSKWGTDKIVCGGLVIFEDLSVKKYTPYRYGPFTNGYAYYQKQFIDNSGAVYDFAWYNKHLHTLVLSNHNYLATINNLATPVTKTSAQTMKITYTLTEITE